MSALTPAELRAELGFPSYDFDLIPLAQVRAEFGLSQADPDPQVEDAIIFLVFRAHALAEGALDLVHQLMAMDDPLDGAPRPLTEDQDQARAVANAIDRRTVLTTLGN